MAETKKISEFTDLQTWQKSHQVALTIYKTTKKFHSDERFGLTNQMRRSAISITSNIAEGFGRRTYKDKAHFYYQARGSMSELKNQLILSRDLSYINIKEFESINDQVNNAHRLLHGLISKTLASSL